MAQKKTGGVPKLALQFVRDKFMSTLTFFRQYCKWGGGPYANLATVSFFTPRQGVFVPIFSAFQRPVFSVVFFISLSTQRTHINLCANHGPYFAPKPELR